MYSVKNFQDMVAQYLAGCLALREPAEHRNGNLHGLMNLP